MSRHESYNPKYVFELMKTKWTTTSHKLSNAKMEWGGIRFSRNFWSEFSSGSTLFLPWYWGNLFVSSKILKVHLVYIYVVKLFSLLTRVNQDCGFLTPILGVGWVIFQISAEIMKSLKLCQRCWLKSVFTVVHCKWWVHYRQADPNPFGVPPGRLLPL